MYIYIISEMKLREANNPLHNNTIIETKELIEIKRV